MSADGMFNQHLDVAVKHYSKLFWLPSLKKVLLSLVLVCVCGSLLLANTFLNIFDGLINGAILGLSLICVSLICDYAISAFVLKQDPIYDLRRTMAFSLFCWLLWFLFIFIGIFVAKLFGSSWWLRLCLLGFSAVLIFRLIVLNATSSTNYKRILTASFIQPFPCVIVFMVFWSVVQNITHSAILFLFYSSVIGLLSVFFFTFILNRAGERMLGFPSLSIFKAFLLNWVMNLNAPFEAFLEKLGEERDVEVSLIKFDYSRPKAVIAVPSVHQGPFKNVGSSLLPSMLKTS
ncbi:MAG: DUF2070 family protein, partial [Candidatus Bathyarchaeia archaeon]